MNISSEQLDVNPSILQDYSMLSAHYANPRFDLEDKIIDACEIKWEDDKYVLQNERVTVVLDNKLKEIPRKLKISYSRGYIVDAELTKVEIDEATYFCEIV